jgi:hypothetical protein
MLGKRSVWRVKKTQREELERECEGGVQQRQEREIAVEPS